MQTENIILIFCFFIYGFAGWVWESIILPVVKRQPFRDSGFLEGPIVPIYGFGAMLVIAINTWIPVQSILIQGLLGGIAACILEYATSYVMEKLYHRRWWDYSDKKLNIRGRVCLEAFICFCMFSAIVNSYVQPYFTKILNQIPWEILILSTTIIGILFVIDVLVTVSVAHTLDDPIKEINIRLQTERDKLKSFKEENQFIKQAINSERAFKHRQKRLLKAYPYLLERKYRNRKRK